MTAPTAPGAALPADRTAGPAASGTGRRPTPRNYTPWAGEWIGAPDLEPPTGAIPGLDGTSRRAGYETLLFRADIVLDDPPPDALLRVASDSRHAVWINGTEIVRGPLRSQPSRMIADEVDVTGLLRLGVNSLAVQVTYYGEPNALWMPARASGGLGSTAALLAEVRVPSQQLVLVASGASWRVARSRAAGRLGRSDVEGVPAEIHDARLVGPRWQTAETGVGWEQAVPLVAGHIAGAGRTRPPVEPYGVVPSQARPAAVAKVIAPIAILHRAKGRDTDPSSAAAHHGEVVHPSEMVRAAELVAGPPRPADAKTLGEGVLIHDFGRVVFGHVEFDLEAPAGVELDLDLRESVTEVGEEGRQGLRYIARGSADRFRSAEPHGLRAIAVRARGEGAADARLREVRVRETVHKGRERAAFVSSDPELDALWRAGLRTLEVCSSDAYIDCPTREQRAWVGDGTVHLEVDLLTSSDAGAARRYIELCASPGAQGLLPMAVAGDIEDAAATTIPAFSLMWVHGVSTYATHQGIDEVVREALPVAERILRWFSQFRDARGTLCDVPGWGLVDWSSTYTDWRSSVFTALWARALVEFADLSHAVGNDGNARWARQVYGAARVGFEDFWDPTRGIYLDRAPDATPRSRAASQLASASAIVAGLVPADRLAGVARRISDPRLLVTRSWLWESGGGFDAAAMDAWMRRPPEPDWAVERQVVRAQPFGLSVVHDALGETGCIDGLLASVRSWSGFLVDGYDTFGEGWGWGTRAHGWSASPTRDLITRVVGARPEGYGGSIWSIDPSLGPLAHARAAIETAHGLLEVAVTGDEIVLDAPMPTRIASAGRFVHLPPGHHAVAR